MNVVPPHAKSVESDPPDRQLKAGSAVSPSSDLHSPTRLETRGSSAMITLARLPSRPDTADRPISAPGGGHKAVMFGVATSGVLPLVASQMIGGVAPTFRPMGDSASRALNHECLEVLRQISIINQKLPYARGELLMTLFKQMGSVSAEQRIPTCKRLLEEVSRLEKQFRHKPLLALIDCLATIPQKTRGEVVSEILWASAPLDDRRQARLITALAHRIGALNVDEQEGVIRSIFITASALASRDDDSDPSEIRSMALSETDLIKLIAEVTCTVWKRSSMETKKKLDLLLELLEGLPARHHTDMIGMLVGQVPNLPYQDRVNAATELIKACDALDPEEISHRVTLLVADLLEVHRTVGEDPKINAQEKFDVLFGCLQALPNRYHCDVIETLADQVPNLQALKRIQAGSKLLAACREAGLGEMRHVVEFLADDLLALSKGLDKIKPKSASARSSGCVLF